MTSDVFCKECNRVMVHSDKTSIETYLRVCREQVVLMEKNIAACVSKAAKQTKLNRLSLKWPRLAAFLLVLYGIK